MRDQTGNTATRASVALWFGEGARPSAAAVRALADTSGGFAVTHDASEPQTRGGASGNWVELLVNGLTFDLLGLAGAPAAAMPAARHSFGLEDTSLEHAQAATIVPGPHLAGGGRMMPIVRSQLALSVRLTALGGVVAVSWGPARSRMATDYFTAATSAWLEGGPFPALGLTALFLAPDGGLQTDGLSFFTGQELRIEPELAEDRLAASELAVHLVNELVGHGSVERALDKNAPDGKMLVLEPSPNKAFVRVRIRD